MTKPVQPRRHVPAHWLAAVESLDAARKRWPDELESFVGLRVPLDRFQEAFDFRGGVKATLVLEG